MPPKKETKGHKRYPLAGQIIKTAYRSIASHSNLRIQDIHIRYAERMSVSVPTLRAWENGVSRPADPHILELIALDAINIGRLDERWLDSYFAHCNVPATIQSTIRQKLVAIPKDAPSHTPATRSPFAGIPAKPPIIVGRAKLLEELVRSVCTEISSSFLIGGLPGVGKTTLLTALAYDPRIARWFDGGILWAGIGPNGSVLQALGHWADVLGVDVHSLDDPDARAQAIRDRIGRQRVLLIIDDVWQPEDVEIMSCGGLHSVHIFSSRAIGLFQHACSTEQTMLVPELSDADAVQLIHRLAPSLNATQARMLVKRVGGLPVALTMIGKAIDEQNNTGLNNLETLQAEQLLQLTQRRRGSPFAARLTLQEIIEISINTLSTPARHLFYALGAFAPKPSTFSMAAATFVGNTEENNVKELLLAGIVEQTGDELSIHQVLADAASVQRCPLAQERHAQFYLKAIYAHQEDWRFIETIYAQVRWAIAQPSNEAKLEEFVNALDNYLELRGPRLEHIELLQKVLKHQEAQNRPDHVAVTLKRLGIVHKAISQFALAIEYTQKALAIFNELDDQAEKAICLNNLGECSAFLGRHTEAIEFHQQALEIDRNLGDEERIARRLNNIGAAYYRKEGASTNVLTYLLESLEIRRKLGDARDIANSLNNIGRVYQALGQFQQALNTLLEALLVQQDAGDLEQLAAIYNNLGSTYEKMGDGARALEYLLQALPIRRQAGDRFNESLTLYNIGLAYIQLDNQQQVLEYFEQAKKLAQEVGNKTVIDSIAQRLTELNL